MKLALALLSNFAVIGALSASADDVLPPRFTFDRYTPMLNHSPFAVATAVASPEAASNFAKDLYIANAARCPEHDMITIMSSSDQKFKEYLTTSASVDGYSIAQIEWSENVGKTKVTISKDGEFATLTFNQAVLSQAAAAGWPIANRMPISTPSILLTAGNSDSPSRALGDIERSSKRASAPPPKAAAVSKLGHADVASIPGVPLSPRSTALSKPLSPSQELSDK